MAVKTEREKRTLRVSDRILHLLKDEFRAKFAGQVYFDVISMVLFRLAKTSAAIGNTLSYAAKRDSAIDWSEN